jgi:hypothetical protein
LEQGTAGGVSSRLLSPGRDLDCCCLQARSSIVVVGTSFLWAREDAAGGESVRLRIVKGAMSRSCSWSFMVKYEVGLDGHWQEKFDDREQAIQWLGKLRRPDELWMSYVNIASFHFGYS